MAAGLGPGAPSKPMLRTLTPNFEIRHRDRSSIILQASCCSYLRLPVRPGHWTATTTFATGCLSTTLSHTAFKSQEKFSRCRSPARAIGSLSILQTVTAFLQFIAEHYSAAGQDQLVFFETNDRMSTKDWNLSGKQSHSDRRLQGTPGLETRPVRARERGLSF
jgi:hypothetical protein